MTTSASTGVPGGLTLTAFRGLRYVPNRISSTAAVTSPPYDVVDPEAVLALESVDPHNVVRLILPRHASQGPQPGEDRYERAGRTLRSWVADGVLTPEDEPGLYVYEQSVDGRVLQRGVVGALGLHDPADRVVLPHEDVMAGPVADRLALMRAARANIEPILLMYDGGRSGATVGVLERLVRQPPLLDATTPDGMRHRLWLLADPVDAATIAADLAGRQALIADGHHRYAAYRGLQAEQDATVGPGAWDSGLALLVDLRAYPPQVGAIHRTVAGLELDQALARADELFTVRHLDTPVLDVLPSLQHGQLVVAVGRAAGALLEARDPDAVAALVARDHPDEWRQLDTATLHHVLVERLWGLPDASVAYHHEAPAALAAAERGEGVAVLLAPVTVRAVLDIAAGGVLMPRKSTSFGPKPRTGLVLRSFDVA